MTRDVMISDQCFY